MPSMEKSSSESKQCNVPECNLKEWSLRARIGRENPNSRRFSASNLKSFREEERSFRSNINIPSTVSSPGYAIKEEIDPSTYSFTAALKALQAKTVYPWEYMPSDKYTLNSKWNDAERYICNPLSGEVPLECLSAKTLSERSFRSLTSRITMSAPLIYPSPLQQFQAKPPILEHVKEVEFIDTIREKKGSATRDVGVQSTPPDLSSGSPTPAPTPSIEERSRKVHSDSSVSSGKLKSEAEVEVRETRDKITKGGRERKKVRMMCRCKCSSSGCLSLKGLWQRDKCKSRKNIDPTSSPTFLYHINACYNNK